MASYANRYSATHRQWDHVGNLFPNVEHSEKGPHGRLAGDFIPAPWLPVNYYDKHFEVWTVVSPGKIVALTTEAEEILSNVGDYEDSTHVVPGGLKVDWTALGGGATAITYTSNDFDEQTSDITTGAPYAVNGTTAYTKTQVTNALISRGLVADGGSCEDFISFPVGVAAQAFYQWSAYNGEKFNPKQTKFHNFRMQHQVQVLVSYQLRLPLIPGIVSTEAIPALTGGAFVIGATGLHTVVETRAMERWDGLSSTGTWLAQPLARFPLAGPTALAPLVASATDVLVRKRTGPDALSQAGDYFVDREAGVIFYYSASQVAVPANLLAETITYYSYEVAPAALSIYASVVPVTGTAPKNGDFLVCDADSNFAVETSVVAATWSNFRIGQIFGFKTYPKDLTHRVKTQYTQLGNVNAMPGTATAGLPETLTYSGGADKEVLVSLINR